MRVKNQGTHPDQRAILRGSVSGSHHLRGTSDNPVSRVKGIRGSLSERRMVDTIKRRPLPLVSKIEAANTLFHKTGGRIDVGATNLARIEYALGNIPPVSVERRTRFYRVVRNERGFLVFGSDLIMPPIIGAIGSTETIPMSVAAEYSKLGVKGVRELGVKVTETKAGIVVNLSDLNIKLGIPPGTMVVY